MSRLLLLLLLTSIRQSHSSSSQLLLLSQELHIRYASSRLQLLLMLTLCMLHAILL